MINRIIALYSLLILTSLRAEASPDPQVGHLGRHDRISIVGVKSFESVSVGLFKQWVTGQLQRFDRPARH